MFLLQLLAGHVASNEQVSVESATSSVSASSLDVEMQVAVCLFVHTLLAFTAPLASGSSSGNTAGSAKQVREQLQEFGHNVISHLTSSMTEGDMMGASVASVHELAVLVRQVNDLRLASVFDAYILPVLAELEKLLSVPLQ